MYLALTLFRFHLLILLSFETEISLMEAHQNQINFNLFLINNLNYYYNKLLGKNKSNSET